MKAKVNFDGQWLPEINFTPQSFSFNDRIKRSSKIFFVYLGLAIFSVFIPVLHFFLTPLFLGLSIYLSIRKFKEVSSVDFNDLSCPTCKKKLNKNNIPLKADDIYIRMNCKDCQKTLTLVIDEN